MAGYGSGWFWLTVASVVPSCARDLGIRRSRSPESTSSTPSFTPESNGHGQRRLVHEWAAEEDQRHER